MLLLIKIDLLYTGEFQKKKVYSLKYLKHIAQEQQRFQRTLYKVLY